MSSTIFNERLQDLKASGKYSKTALEQIEASSLENDGKLPKEFYVQDIGRSTLSHILNDLGIHSYKIEVPNGSGSSLRKVILY